MLGRWTCRLNPRLRVRNWPPTAQWRQSSTFVPGRILRGDDLGPTRTEGHRTFRERKDEQAKALPLPPLLDPVALEDRHKWQRPKDRPKHAEFTPFQKKLCEIPFARVLASPVRQCRLTTILLPSDLLMAVYPRPHPETNDPWLLPVSLVSEQSHLGPPLYFVGHRHVATQLGKKKTWEKVLPLRMVAKLSGLNLKNMIWREDMPDLILQAMRNKVSKKLSSIFIIRDRLIPVASPRAEDIEHVDDVSCVLLFGSLRTRADEYHEKLIQIQQELEKWATYTLKHFAAKIDPHASPDVTHHSPNWYAEPLVPRLQPRLKFPELSNPTTIWRGRKVALYSLTDLLGEKKAQELVKGNGSKYGDAKCVAITRSKHHAPAEISLMQLQAYVARPAP
ncbi:hypothetical protein IAQ61_010196 [Plenodomus lingam]|uniref:Predicted protein n=1 Tax=Leptosphaeria maculans (strain JN3 / isolate v23.1.3 / race Av1-4-5-6-7-8) TaxID=985895 RepID=E5A378_LEPMJ|nr:predicted protein [Plenodomus lingam JN3]KAH9861995.1 hypothetical protein IAQ61_010196 [Plenodomus lingam]CBX98091.1 predicted protein [Plenodomus lingam JN3]